MERIENQRRFEKVGGGWGLFWICCTFLSVPPSIFLLLSSLCFCMSSQTPSQSYTLLSCSRAFCISRRVCHTHKRKMGLGHKIHTEATSGEFVVTTGGFSFIHSLTCFIILFFRASFCKLSPTEVWKTGPHIIASIVWQSLQLTHTHLTGRNKRHEQRSGETSDFSK